MNNGHGHVLLVGAGPGDAGLITVRGIESLKRADVVVHDRLIPQELLAACRADAERIDVGRAPDQVPYTPQEIQDLLVEHALAGRVVVRLKGGDSFVFARGYEELEACRAAGVRCTVVPGVTSALAAPACVGVPLTQRKVARSFAVITGNTEDNVLPPHDYAALARVDSLAILMGGKNLAAIVERLIEEGRSPDTPACAISNATMANQRSVHGTLASIAQRVMEAELRPPMVTVIGATAALAEPQRLAELNGSASLVGRRLILTQARDSNSELVRQLHQAGATVIEAPLIRIAYPDAAPALDTVLDDLRRFDWLVFTSVHGVRGFWRRLAQAGLDARALAGARVAAVGPGTARELRASGIHADFVPRVHQGRALVAELSSTEALRGRAILLPQGSAALPTVASELVRAGAKVTAATVYETHAADPDPRDRARLTQPADALVFTSPSAVHNFARLGLAHEAGTVACIGSTTAGVARAAGLNVEIEPAKPGSAGLVAALKRHFASPRDGVTLRDALSCL